ncbi:MAG: hypothetical protein HKN39_04380 [Flavobacteriales bacterium]|nr:hypothetical protein [Flavobacteriales bacterium]
MKFGILITLFLVFIGCEYVAEREPENNQIEADSTGLIDETPENQIENSILNSFLENPIDLQEYKKKKQMRFTSSVTNGLDYYYKPEVRDSIFYVYYYRNEEVLPKEIDKIVVFKHGKNKHAYEDETETLIELRVFNKDSDLGKGNLVGLTKTELETKFGSDYLTLNNRIVYSNKNKVLIIELDNKRVKSFNYLKLSSEKIDSDQIGRIIK